MKVSRVLREAPSADAAVLGSVAAGTKVTVLDDSKLPYTKIQVDLTKAEGWVVDEAIDKNSDVLGPLDKVVVAAECVELAAEFGANAFYLMTVAQLRSDIIQGVLNNGAEKGVYAFTDKEWLANADQPDYQIKYTTADMDDWRAQCTLFAIMAAKAQDNLEASTNSKVSMVQLFLAQTIGVQAAEAGIQTPTDTVEKTLSAITENQAAADGIDPANFTGRDAALLVGPSISDVFTLLDTKLTAGLANIEQFVADQSEAFMKKLAQLSDLNPVAVGNINFNSSRIPNGRKDMAVKIAEQFAAKGYGALQQIAAIANAIAESGLDPTKSNLRGERSFGLFQLNQNGGVGFGHSDAELLDPDRNIQIMLEEIQKPYLKSSRVKFIAAPSLRDAVQIFVFQFEKPADKAGETAKRFEIAQTLVA